MNVVVTVRVADLEPIAVPSAWVAVGLMTSASSHSLFVFGKGAIRYRNLLHESSVRERLDRSGAEDLHSIRPLGKQLVHRDDSALGGVSRFPRKGLEVASYNEMIEEAFHRRWWDSTKCARVADDGDCRSTVGSENEYTLAEYTSRCSSGSRYRCTRLRSSPTTPWDRFRRAHPTDTDPALNPWTNAQPDHISRLALFGAHLFNDRTRGPTNLRCSNGHEQAELTDASVRQVRRRRTAPCATVTATSSTKATRLSRVSMFYAAA